MYRMDQKRQNFTFRMPPMLKEKLYSDCRRYNFPTPSAYLCELVKRGINLTEPIDLKLKVIDQKIETLTSFIKANDQGILPRMMFLIKRVMVIYKIVANSLARNISMAGNEIPEESIMQTNSIIEWEFARVEKKFEKDIEWW